jgi:hypothetical protein
VSEGHLLRSGSAPPAGLGELFVRHARKEGRSIAVFRAVDHGDAVTVEVEVFPPEGGEPAPSPGPFRFQDAREATIFATEAVEALRFLGCDVQAA